MASSFLWMDSKLQNLSNDTKNNKFRDRTKNLCKLQSMKLFAATKELFALVKLIAEVKELFALANQKSQKQATGLPRRRTLRRNEGHAAQRHL